MKPMSVLAVCAASFALVATAACHKDEPASETNTTSAPLTPDQPVVTPQTPTVTTGTIDNGTAPQQNVNGTPSKIQNNNSSTPSGGADMMDHGSNTSSTQGAPVLPPDQIQNQNKNGQNGQQMNQATPSNKNHSTTLGDGKSGEYTGGMGTNGGKATWGTGPQKGTQMGSKPAATQQNP